MATKARPFKYREQEYLDEVRAYISSTYQKHYSSPDGIQFFDLILATGHAKGFCAGNLIKYPTRFGKKDGWNRIDILKLIHYALMLLYAVDRDEMV